MFETILLPSILLGMSATSVPGPLQAYLLSITLKYGWRRGLYVIFSPLLTDGPIIVMAVFVLRQIPEWVIQMIRIGGGILLLWIAWNAWQQVRRRVTFKADDTSKGKGNESPRRILMTACAMNLLSPGPYLFWSTVTGPLLIKALDLSLWAGVAMIVAFYGTFLTGMALLVFFFSRLGAINARVTQLILILTIALLVWFAAQLIIAEALGWSALYTLITILIIVLVIGYIFWNWRDSRIGKHV